MKILFLSDNFPPERNAPAIRTYEHARQWVQDGHEVTVVTTAPNFPEGRVFEGFENGWHSVSTVDGIRVVRVKTYVAANKGRLRRTLDYASFMLCGGVAAMFERRPDVMVSTSPQFLCAVSAWVVSRFRRLPWIFELRDLWPESIVTVEAMRPGLMIRLLKWLEMTMYRDADAIVSVTNSFKKELVSRGVAADKIHVVLNGVDRNRFKPQPKDDAILDAYDLRGHFVVGYLGTVGMAHAIPKVIEAFQFIPADSGIRLVICGPGARLADAKNLAGDLGLSNVVFMPAQDRDKMAAVWSVQDVALVSLRDAPLFATVIPSKIFEAMSMGVPMLMTMPFGEAVELVQQAGAGTWVAPEQPKALAEEILRLKDDPSLLQQLSEGGQNAAVGHTRSEQARRMMTVLEAVASDRSQDATVGETCRTAALPRNND